MKNIIEKFVKYPVLGNSILVAIFLFGLMYFINIKTTFFPEVESKTIFITAIYPGASPEEIEEGIVLKIEDNLRGLTGVERVTSTSSENSASITVELASGYDVNIVLQDVKNAVDQISSFPADMEELLVYKQEPRDFAVSLVISGNVSLKELKDAAQKVERELLAVDGISKLSLSGFPDEEIIIGVRDNSLRKYGLTFASIASAINKANIKVTGGKIKGAHEEFQIRANAKEYYAADMANIVVKTTADGAVVRLKDIAELSDGWSDDPNRVYYNGKLAVRVVVNSTNDEDLFFVSDYVKDYIERFNLDNPGIEANVMRDGSMIINERINILVNNGMLGLVLVLLFLSLALNSRLAFWVALAIPISFAGMFMIGAFYGLTINVMSLMAMILVVGILVDDGIVFAENIYQHYERGEKPLKAAINGTLEVLPAVVSSILTTVVVFMTFFFLEGRLGDSAKDVAFIVVITLIFSLIEGIFILPAHIAHSRALHMTSSQRNKIEQKSAQILRSFRDKVYSPTLRFCVKNPIIAIATATALFLITLGALSGSIIKMTFFPNIERDYVGISLEMPSGTPDRITDSLLTRIEPAIWVVDSLYRDGHDGMPLIESVSRSVGPGSNEGEINANLVESRYREWGNMEVSNRIRQAIGPVEGAENFEVGDLGGRFGKPVSIVLSSNDLQQLRQAKEVLKDELRQIDKLKDVVDDDLPGLREVKITPKAKAYALGLTLSDIMSQVRGGFYGNQAQRIVRGTDEVKIYVRYKDTERGTISKLGDMRIRDSYGNEYPLEEVANFTIEQGIKSISHIDGRRVITVEANLADTKESVVDIISDIRTDVLPGVSAQFTDVDFKFEGQSRESAKTGNAIFKIVPPLLILMFLIIVITFRSFIQAITVFSLIPLSIVGVSWGHFLQGYMISMLSLFGIIALAGIVVNNSLVLVSSFNALLKKGASFYDSLIQAGESRFRPVLLTSLTTIAGLGPLMFSRSHHAQFLSPMAISIAYGLLFGTFLTLLVLPALLVIVNRVKVFIFSIIKGAKVTPESVEPAVREEAFAKE